MKTIFQGSLPVAGKGYVQEDSWAMSWPGRRGLEKRPAGKISHRDLGTVVAWRATFELGYPFDGPERYQGTIEPKGGITLRDIIAAIRRGYRAMYRGAKVEKLHRLRNRLVTSKKYGKAFHDIGDLVISRIRTTGERLIVDIDS